MATVATQSAVRRRSAKYASSASGVSFIAIATASAAAGATIQPASARSNAKTINATQKKCAFPNRNSSAM